MSNDLHGANVKRQFRQLDPDVEIIDIGPLYPDSIDTCCVCNSNASLCVPEHPSGSVITTASAKTVSYLFW